MVEQENHIETQAVDNELVNRTIRALQNIWGRNVTITRHSEIVFVAPGSSAKTVIYTAELMEQGRIVARCKSGGPVGAAAMLSEALTRRSRIEHSPVSTEPLEDGRALDRSTSQLPGVEASGGLPSRIARAMAGTEEADPFDEVL